MEFTFAKHVVYKKDSEGSTYSVGEVVHKDQIIQHAVAFSAIDTVLNTIQDFTHRKDDLWILDYPKSGTHWVNDIVTLMCTNEVTSPMDKEKTMLEFSSDLQQFEKLPSPRILNTHINIKYFPEHLINNSKAIFVLRNPKSVAVSYYHHHRNLCPFEYEGTFAGFFPVFLEGLDNLYGTWFEAVTDFWKKYKDNPNVLIVIYEDLKQHPVEEVKRIADFIGLQKDTQSCEQVVEKTKFETMKAKEGASLKSNPIFRGSEGVYRKGSSTDWKSHFTVAQNEMFDAVYEEKMKDYPDLKEKIRFS